MSNKSKNKRQRFKCLCKKETIKYSNFEYEIWRETFTVHASKVRNVVSKGTHTLRRGDRPHRNHSRWARDCRVHVHRTETLLYTNLTFAATTPYRLENKGYYEKRILIEPTNDNVCSFVERTRIESLSSYRGIVTEGDR